MNAALGHRFGQVAVARSILLLLLLSIISILRSGLASELGLLTLAVLGQLFALLDLLEERIGANRLVLNRSDDLVEVVNLILLQLLLHSLLVLELLLSPIDLSLLALLFLALSLLSLLLKPFLALFVLAVTPVLLRLPLAELPLHLIHPVDVLDEELLLGVGDEGTVVLVLELIFLLVELVSLVSSTLSAFVDLV